MKRIDLILFGLCAVLGVSTLRADQPLFNEMPRWSGGWGFQFVQEYRNESDLLLGDRKVQPGFEEVVHITHFEGVYTWDKSVRVTWKIPYVVSARRELPDGAGGKRVQYDKGIGDPVLALPLKHYFNLDGRSGSWTLAPQLRIPLSGKDEYEIYSNEWGGGLSFGYETETYDWIAGAGISAWGYSGDKPMEVDFQLQAGPNVRAFGSSGHIKWVTKFHWEDDGSETVSTGPLLYWRFLDLFHAQITWRHDVHDRQAVLDHGNGNRVTAGFGFVF